MARLIGSFGCAAMNAPRVVNVHQAKTHLSRLIPLAPPPAQRIPGRLRSQGPLSNPNALLEPLEADELAGWEERNLLPEVPHP
jgi:hypothetical protein